jgi:hypothetical protein
VEAKYADAVYQKMQATWKASLKLENLVVFLRDFFDNAKPTIALAKEEAIAALSTLDIKAALVVEMVKMLEDLKKPPSNGEGESTCMPPALQDHCMKLDGQIRRIRIVLRRIIHAKLANVTASASRFSLPSATTPVLPTSTSTAPPAQLLPKTPHVCFRPEDALRLFTEANKLSDAVRDSLAAKTACDESLRRFKVSQESFKVARKARNEKRKCDPENEDRAGFVKSKTKILKARNDFHDALLEKTELGAALEEIRKAEVEAVKGLVLKVGRLVEEKS